MQVLPHLPISLHRAPIPAIPEAVLPTPAEETRWLAGRPASCQHHTGPISPIHR